MNVAACQLDIVWENKPANHAKVRALLEQARPARDTLVVLPEMFATGFSMNVAQISDTPSAETLKFLSATAREFSICLVAGLVTTAGNGKGRNEAVVIAPTGKEITRYCKMRTFTFGGETDHYVAGEKPCVFACGEFQVAPFICYDLRFPEVLRTAVQQGAQLLAVIANWPSARHEHWVTLLKARAIENQSYVVGVNRVGRDPNNEYAGQSMIIGPRGEVLTEAGNKEIVISAELDLKNLTDYRRDFPALKDARLAE